MRKFLSRQLSAISYQLALLFLLASGCVNGRPTAGTLIAITAAVNVGGSIALHDEPKWRPQFQSAHDKLGTLLATGHLDYAQLRAILNALPVKELGSFEARLIFDTVGIAFEEYLKAATDITKLAAVTDVGTAIYNGLDLCLKATPEQLRAIKIRDAKARTLRDRNQSTKPKE